ncbi:MAG: class I SAM-dependent methyltransferase [Mesorhizobium sp.]|uniref:class I SAM-dependent DNA methyltransferase n=1 Tax=Mesorhizobium sp. TaxID=1871066 RepID=UPI000FE9DF03|nr:class I SAM-dependent methyltransferase [Mesorhizobium sp.]RWG50461.1 MAG: class I SAM-dependent methyltransferase [Mesorhizobium sp.]RWL05217.1 MAG: class I SAM-dependent methyltransferase [Mesorhizobium sp.]TIN10240.1 MAG: class I SAM-dependent methyltransferase [Mesorhizobium sp.]TIQ62163.1 MAG: class I SAM-dependent methyltransferase [Mesorhizobium sp.]
MQDNFIYADDWAAVYEQITNVRGRVAEADDTVAFLERHCSGGCALELGIGDGRVAVPLSAQGVRVEGIDNSDSMLKLLATRTDVVKAWHGDIANFIPTDRYNTVFCIYNTFMLLFTREAQISCLRSAASALKEGGTLVIEIEVPALDGFVNGQKTTTLQVDHENTILRTDVHDPLKQNLVSSFLWFSETSVRRLPHRVRYVHHQELDTMADCVGLKLVERLADWTGGAFTQASTRHISVYRRAGL